MKKFTIIILLAITLVNSLTVNVYASEARPSISDLPFEGYFLAPDDHAVEGLLFEENQLYIYLTNQDDLAYDAPGLEWVHFLAGFHSFPHPDLLNYSEAVRDVYLKENDLAYDLQAVYQEITAIIRPEMSQTDIQNLINNRIPGIFYTEKNDYQYYIIASPTVVEDNGLWQITLFGQDLYTLEVEADKGIITDQDGVTYDYIAGIKPN